MNHESIFLPWVECLLSVTLTQKLPAPNGAMHVSSLTLSAESHVQACAGCIFKVKKILLNGARCANHGNAFISFPILMPSLQSSALPS